MNVAKKKTLSVVISIVLIFIYSVSFNRAVFDSANYFVFDLQSANIAKKLPADNEIVVITIDDYSLAKMNDYAGRWVWPRTVQAQLVEGLFLNEKKHQYDLTDKATKVSSPKALVFDVLFAEPDIYRPDADLYFNEILEEVNKQSGKVFFSILQQTIVKGGGKLLSDYPLELALVKTDVANNNAKASFVLPRAINKSYWQLGTINFSQDEDGVGRFYDVRRNIDGWQINSLPAQVISSLAEVLPEQDSILLQWRGDSQQPFTTFSYVDVYQAILANNANYLTQFKNKIIIVGATASGLFDSRATAVNNSMPGVYMLAMAIDNLKNHRFVMPLPPLLQLLLGIFLLSLISASFTLVKGYSKRVTVAFSLLLLSLITLFYLSQFLLMNQQALFIGVAWLFMLASFLMHALLYGYFEYQQRQQTLAMFSRFLDPEMVQQLLKTDELLMSKLNKKQMVTVLFSDIRGFTTLAEKKSAEEVVKLLNGYFNQQVAIIFKHKGTLDKFIGDCIMAFWGAPVAIENHAVASISAALAMEQQLLEFRKTLPIDLQGFNVGIGIHSGESIVGMIGADLRVDYTVIGDAVNLASRIEGLTKDNSRILVSEQTMLLAKDAFIFQYQGEHSVKGRTSAVKLYSPSLKY